MKSPFDGLSEYVSRRARVELVESIMSGGFTQQDIADEVGVSQQAVHKWLDPEETHPSNKNLDVIIGIALESEESRASEILCGELLNFLGLLIERLNSK
ncbi:MAG: hypothetical protein KGY45_00130 [Hadesarchaea archaeon]|nr:hypothetical protein [Hadesarchaea archaeon]